MAQSVKGMPQVGMLFKGSEAWLFWRAYGGRAGFDVRKRYNHVSKFDGKVTSCKFVCANEGHQKKGQRIESCQVFQCILLDFSNTSELSESRMTSKLTTWSLASNILCEKLEAGECLVPSLLLFLCLS